MEPLGSQASSESPKFGLDFRRPVKANETPDQNCSRRTFPFEIFTFLPMRSSESGVQTRPTECGLVKSRSDSVGQFGCENAPTWNFDYLTLIKSQFLPGDTWPPKKTVGLKAFAIAAKSDRIRPTFDSGTLSPGKNGNLVTLIL